MTGLSRSLVLLLAGALSLSLAPALTATAARAAPVSGLKVSVAYAEDKENNSPSAAAFPVPWNGAPNTTFLGAPVPGLNACGTLTICYDTGAMRLDNPGPADVTVAQVSVDMHSSVAGGAVFNNLWGAFTVAAGKSVILAANPPFNNPNFDNFDTSGFPANNCTPLTVAPTVTVTIGGVATTLADSTHVLDTGGIDAGFCPPKLNESIPWRQIGAAGGNSTSLSLAPTTMTHFAGQQGTETATFLDGGGAGLPNATVDFSVTSGPNIGRTGSAVTDFNGHAAFTYPDTNPGEDIVAASVTGMGGTVSSNQARVMWTNDSTTGWSSADIGGATPAGSETLNTMSGAWTVRGGGSDIGGTADQFHFLSQTLSGGGGVASRVFSQTGNGQSPAAKAGAMLRQTLNPGSPYYAAFVTPGNGILIQDRAALGGATVVVASQPGVPPAYLWVANSGNTYSAYGSADGFVWTLIPGSTVTLNLGSTLLAGLAVTSHNSFALSTAVIDKVAVTSSPPPPALPIACPAPWTCADIGSPPLAGSQSFDPNTATWTINGGGADITGASDQFRYVWQTLTGDGSVSARVTAQGNTSPQAKAGVMFRQSTDPASPNYAVVVTTTAGIKVQVRTTLGGATAKLANPTGTVPAYLKVSNIAGSFSAYTSADGVNWTLIPGSTIALNLGPSVVEGLAVTSHNTGALSTTTMDNVVLTSGSPPPPPPPPCPAPWTCADIGAPTPAGSQAFDPNTATWTINAGGADIGGASDQFRYVWQTLTGDGSISARVASQGNTSLQAKAGLMFRQSTDPASPGYAAVVSPGAGIMVLARTTLGGSPRSLPTRPAPRRPTLRSPTSPAASAPTPLPTASPGP